MKKIIHVFLTVLLVMSQLPMLQAKATSNAEGNFLIESNVTGISLENYTGMSRDFGFTNELYSTKENETFGKMSYLSESTAPPIINEIKNRKADFEIEFGPFRKKIGDTFKVTVIETLLDGTKVDVSEEVNIKLISDENSVKKISDTNFEAIGVGLVTVSVEYKSLKKEVYLSIDDPSSKLDLVEIGNTGQNIIVGEQKSYALVEVLEDGSFKDFLGSTSSSFRFFNNTVSPISYRWIGSTIRLNAVGSGTFYATIRGNVDGSSYAARVVVIGVPRLLSSGLNVYSSKQVVNETDEISLYSFETFSNSNDDKIRTKDTTFTVSDPSIATITGNKLKALKPGTVEVTAKYGSYEYKGLITIHELPTSIQITPANQTVKHLSATKLVVEGKLANGDVREITDTINFTVSDPNIGTMNGNIFNATNIGEVEITADYYGMTSTANLTVEPNFETVKLTYDPSGTTMYEQETKSIKIEMLFSDNSRIDVTDDAKFSIPDPSMGVFSGNKFTALKAGKVNLNAYLDTPSYKGGVNFSFEIKPLSTGITITPETTMLLKGEKVTFKVEENFSDGTKRNVTGYTQFTVDDATLAKMTAYNVLEALDYGDVKVTASYNGKTTTATVTIYPSTTGITVTPDTKVLVEGEKVAFKVEENFSNGTKKDVTSDATFAVDEVTLAQMVDNELEALKYGEVKVAVNYKGYTETATITINPASTGITVTPETKTLIEGEKVSFKVEENFSDGSKKDVTTDATFAVNKATLAQMKDNELEALKYGEVKVAVNYKGYTETATITIKPKSTGLTLSPNISSMLEGTTEVFSLVEGFTDNSTQDRTADTNFEVSDENIASVVGNQLTAKKFGKITLTASYAGQKKTLVIEIKPKSTGFDISPTTKIMFEGDEELFTLTEKFTDGTTVNRTGDTRFTSSNPNIASMTGNKLKAVKAGTVTVTATYNGYIETATVTVNPVSTGITITPETKTLIEGEKVTFKVEENFSDGSKKDVTTNTIFAVDKATLAQMKDNELEALKYGEVKVAINYKGYTKTATITINPASTGITVTPETKTLIEGEKVTFKVEENFSDRSKKDVTTDSTFAVDKATLAQMMGNELEALKYGEVKVTVTYNGYTEIATVTINPASTGITVTPETKTLIEGEKVTFKVEENFSDGSKKDVTTDSTFAVDKATLAQMKDNELEALKYGEVKVAVNYKGYTKTATITINPASTGITVTPETKTLIEGEKVTFKVEENFSDGTKKDVTTVATFAVDKVTLAQMTGNELETLKYGEVKVTVTYNGYTEIATVTINPASTGFTLTPVTKTLLEGEKETFTLTENFSDGSTKDVTANTTFTVDNPKLGSIAGNEFEALKTGIVTVTADYNGNIYTATITVNPVSTGFTITPKTATVTVGNKASFTITEQFSDGTTKDVTANSSFTVSDTAIATVAANELITVKAGTVTVSATYNGKTETATVTVVNRVIPSPPNQPTPLINSERVNGQQHYSATISREHLQSIISTYAATGDRTAQVDFPQDADKATLTAPQAIVKYLSDEKIDLLMNTIFTKVWASYKSLLGFNGDLKFEAMPSSASPEDLENQASQNEQVLALVGPNKRVRLVGKAVDIKTNLQNQSVTITLPIPNNLKAEQLESLFVFILHSDGTIEAKKGRVVDLAAGSKGFAFDVTHFSTFALMYAEAVEVEEPKEEPVEEPGEEQPPTQPVVLKPYIYGTPNGMFKPEDVVTRGQMALMIARYLTNGNIPVAKATFVDTKQNEAKDAIEFVKQLGIFNGVSETTFDANGTFTRGQMAAITARFVETFCKGNAEKPYCQMTGKAKVFDDVKATHWAADMIGKVSAMGIMIGKDDKHFDPDAALTRAQAVKVLNILFERPAIKGLKASKFKDVPATHWAIGEIEAAATEYRVDK